MEKREDVNDGDDDDDDDERFHHRLHNHHHHHRLFSLFFSPIFLQLISFPQFRRELRDRIF